MTHEDAGHYAGKHPKGTVPDADIARALKQKSADSRITCAASHKIAGRLGVSPAEVGKTSDLMELRLNKCQLGLFGYGPEKKIAKPADQVSPELENAIKAAAADNRISCLSCWQIAEDMGCAKKDVADACETLVVKIGPCQIGAF